jgi:electron-transferring-flavoprotein dehydrogenase
MSTDDREVMDYDVVIVGAGPSGLATAIRLKQLDPALSVVVLEKGAEVGAHILSGAVIDPRPLDDLLPGWREEDTPLITEVREDHFSLLTAAKRYTIPNALLPKLMSNHGNFIVSLGNVCRWLAEKAEVLGVEIYAGFAGAELLYDGTRVSGVATGDMGRHRDGSLGESFQRGMAIHGTYTVLAEGARGSLTKEAIARFDLAKSADCQKYGIGFKELWEVLPEFHHHGRVEHSFGWPLDWRTGGGSFLYHLENNQVAVGYVVHLNYTNPFLSPFDEFQRFKQHPSVRSILAGGRRISYGSRVISEGGWQSVPKLSFPGGVLVGDGAGFVNLPRIKGTHNALLSGMLAAEHLAQALSTDKPLDLTTYDTAWRRSAIGQDLHRVRNVKPLWSRFGLFGVALGGIDMWLHQFFGRGLPTTLGHGKPDHACLNPAAQSPKIAYPKPDNIVTFDRLSSVYLSSTNHREDEPIHLKLCDANLQRSSELETYAGPSTRYCPAGVYEWTESDTGPRFQINAQNCIHCKTCDVKDPNQNITWTVPEGGDGPSYPNM